MPLPDFLDRLLRGRAQHLHWAVVPPDQVLPDQGGPPPAAQPPFVAGEDYIVVRLAEMFLRETRRLWREQHGMVHAYVTTGDPKKPTQHTAIAGPGQLKELGSEGLDRLVSLSHRLAGPVVHDGQDIELLVGLYAVPGQNHAKVLIEMLGAVAALAAPAASEALALAEAVRNGLEGVLGLKGTSLQLGVHETLRAADATGHVPAGGKPLRPSFLAGIALPAGDIDPGRLWIRGGSLRFGDSPFATQPFDRADYLLVEVARGPSRKLSWPLLSGLGGFEAAFSEALATPGDVAVKEAKLNEVWPRFETAVMGCPDLTGKPDGTTGDRQAVISLMAASLRERLDTIRSGKGWERKSARGAGRQPGDPRQVSVLDFEEDAGAPFFQPRGSLIG